MELEGDAGTSRSFKFGVVPQPLNLYQADAPASPPPLPPPSAVWAANDEYDVFGSISGSRRQRPTPYDHVGEEGLVTPVGYSTGGGATAIVPAALPTTTSDPTTLVPYVSPSPAQDPGSRIDDVAATANWAIGQANARAVASADLASQYRTAAEYTVAQARQAVAAQAAIADQATATANALAVQGQQVQVAAHEQVQSVAHAATLAVATREQEIRQAAHLELEQIKSRLTAEAQQALARQLAHVETQASQALVTREQEVRLAAQGDLENARSRLTAEAEQVVLATREQAETRHKEVIQSIEQGFATQLAHERQLQREQANKLLEVQTDLMNHQERMNKMEGDMLTLTQRLQVMMTERDAERAARASERQRAENALRELTLKAAEKEKGDTLALLQAQRLCTEHKQRADDLEMKLRLALAQTPDADKVQHALLQHKDNAIAGLQGTIAEKDQEISNLESEVRRMKVMIAAAVPPVTVPQEFGIGSRHSPSASARFSIEDGYENMASPPSFDPQRPSGPTGLAGASPTIVPPSEPHARGRTSGRDTPISGIGAAEVWGHLHEPDPGNAGSSVRIGSRERSTTAVPQSNLKLSLGDTIKFTRVPTIASQLASWKESVRNGVAACAVTSDLAWKWVKVVERHEITLDDLAESNALLGLTETNHELSRLDYKLKQELTNKISENGLIRFIKRAEAKNQDEKEIPLKGRQILWLVYQYFSVGDTHEKIHRLASLMRVEWKGDDHISTFLDDWTDVYTQLIVKPDEETLKEILLQQVRKSQREMKHTLEEWDKMEPHTQTYNWLLEALDRKVATRRRLANMADVASSVNNRKGNAPPAAPGPTPASKTPATPGPLKPNNAQKGGGATPTPKGGFSATNVDKPLCFAFAETGKCSRPSCTYAHCKATAQELKQIKERTNRAPSGDRPRTPSPAPGPAVCINYTNHGSCKFGDDCKFAHPGHVRKPAAKPKAKAKGGAKS